MPLPPLSFGGSADPIRTPTNDEQGSLLGCGPLDLALLNGLLKVLADRINAVDQADNAIASAVYDPATNALTFTMADGPNVVIPLTPLISDAVATGLISSSSYNASTNILTLTMASGDAVNIDMTDVLADAVASGAFVPTSRTINTTSPLQIDGASSADLNGNRTLSLDMAALVSDLDSSFVTPTELATAFTNFVTSNQPRAGTFAVTANNSGTVNFANPFPAGTIPVIAFANYGNKDGGDEADEDLWVTSASATAFSWESSGDGPGYNVGYIATPAF